MASKSVYQDFDVNALNYFELESSPIYGLVSSSNKVNKVLCTINKDAYDKIYNILSKPSKGIIDLKSKKKAFVLPKSDLSQDRLKAILKENKITTTNDYKKADLIIGHTSICNNVLQSGSYIPSNVMMNHIRSYETTNGQGLDSDIYDKLKKLNIDCLLTKNISSRYWQLSTKDYLYDRHIITGMAVNIAYFIESNNISVIDTKTLIESSTNKTIIDEQLLSDIKLQLRSNKDDRAIAKKFIPTICTNTNLHLLWQLSRDYNNLFWSEGQDKDLKHWIEKSRLKMFAKKSASDMISWLHDNKLLCKISFKYLEAIARSKIIILDRSCYSFKVMIKDEYKEYLI